MDIPAIAAKAVKKRFSRAGRTFKGEAMSRQLDAAGKPSSEHHAFNYPTGSAVKSAERLLQLLGEKDTYDNKL